MKRVILLTLSACMGAALWAAPATNAKKPFIEDGVKPRVLSDYVEQDKDTGCIYAKTTPFTNMKKRAEWLANSLRATDKKSLST